MRTLFGAYGCTLEASASNLFETFAIPLVSNQRAEIETLVLLADEFERQPISWLHAVELRNELRQKRPTWIRPISFTRNAKKLLRGHMEVWREANAFNLPPPMPMQPISGMPRSELRAPASSTSSSELTIQASRSMGL